MIKTVMYFSVLLMTLLFSSLVRSFDSSPENSQEPSQGSIVSCYTVKGNVCVVSKSKLETLEVVEPFDDGYWDSIYTYSGAMIWDSIVGGAQSKGNEVGEQLAKLAIAEVAGSLGVPTPILNMMGLGGGVPSISNDQLLLELERLIREQTDILLNAIEAGNEELKKEIFSVNSDFCLNEVEARYDAALDIIERWNKYDAFTKQSDPRITEIEIALLTLDEIKSLYHSGVYSEGDRNCFWGKNVDLFSWVVYLSSIEISTRLAIHNVTSRDIVARISNSKSDLLVFKDDINNLVSYLEDTHATSNLLSYDEDAIGDKRNIWWDDVVISFTEVEEVPQEERPYCSVVDVKSNSLINGQLTKNYTIPVSDSSPKGDAYSHYYRYCPGHFKYSVDGREFTLSSYSLRVSGRYYSEIRSVVVADGFWGDEGGDANEYNGSTFKVSDPVACSGRTIENCLSGLKGAVENIARQHMDLEYLKRLQMAYMPYQGFLDKVWKDIGEIRPLNKLDRELERLNDFNSLDFDGLSIAQEITIGTNPEKLDTDSDGMNDGWEYKYGLDPLDPSDSGGNQDGDSYTNIQEYRQGYDPNNFDTPPLVSTPTSDPVVESFSWSAAVYPYDNKSKVVLSYSVRGMEYCVFNVMGVSRTYNDSSAKRNYIRLDGELIEEDTLAEFTCYPQSGEKEHSITKVASFLDVDW